MKSKRTFIKMIVWSTALLALLIATVIFALRTFYTPSKPDLGSLPDWLGLMINIIIAAITVFIAVNAKKLLHDKVYTEGFNRASKLMDDIDILYQKSNMLFFKTHRMVKRFDISLSKENNENIYYGKVIENAEELLDEIIVLQSELFNIEVSAKKLSRWSLRNHQQASFESFTFSFANLLRDLYDITHYISFINTPDRIISSKDYRDKIENSNTLKMNVDTFYNYLAIIPFKELFSITERDK